MRDHAAPRTVVAGVDLGGTGSRVVIWGDGAECGGGMTPTAAFGTGSPQQRLERLATFIRTALPDDTRLGAVGIGASGPVDRGTGQIDNCDTLPGLSGFPILAPLGALLGCPVVIDNDAATAARGEHGAGAGRGARRLLMVTLGTGIGTALLLDGQPFRGPDGQHPEGGHLPIATGPDAIRCYCGILGCWEQHASRSALQDLLRPLLPPATPAALLLAAGAEARDRPEVRAAFAAYGSQVGRGLGALHSLYRPDVTVLGGSAAAHLDLFLPALLPELIRIPGYSVPVDIREAALAEAGAVGAALMALPFA